MAKNFYTLLILPKDSAAKKIGLSSTAAKGFSLFMLGLLLSLMYFSYDYIHIRREQAELQRLKQKTAEQKREIEGLTTKVDEFTLKLESLRQLDEKIRILANLVVGKDKEQLLGIGGPMSDEHRVRSGVVADDRTVLVGIGRQLDRLMNDASSREKSFADLLAFLKEKKSLLASTPSLWPVVGWVTSEFGRRTSPFDGGREIHKAIDIATRFGTPIQAPADGVVTEVGFHQDVGRMIRIDHGHGMSTFYGHLSKTAVRAGEAVHKGERIGYVGSTGRSTGPHLHYAVTLNGVAVNPRKYLN